jgi:hypothetical protein
MSEERVKGGRIAQMKFTALFLAGQGSPEETSYWFRKKELFIRVMTGVSLTPNQIAELLFCEENPGSKRLT